MNYGEVFRDLAFTALSREETVLKKYWESNQTARSLGIMVAREETLTFIIAKAALENKEYPRVMVECPYHNGGKVDLCFVDEGDKPLASFELKIFTPWEKGAWRLQEDVRKHLDPANGIENACEGHKRYNAVIVVEENNKPPEDYEDTVRKEIDSLVRNSVFCTSESIALNHLVSTDPETQFCADRWRQLRIVVFTGEYVASGG